jgi:hypothetical protein
MCETWYLTLNKVHETWNIGVLGQCVEEKDGLVKGRLSTTNKHTVALESAEPLAEMISRNLLGGKKRPARETHNLTAMCEPIVSRSQNLMGLQGLLQG